MKKHLIAAAVAAAVAVPAMAQNVTVYGTIDINIKSLDTGTNRTTAMGNDPLGTTRIGLRGTEDLGGGLKANFQLQGAWDPAAGGVSSNDGQNFSFNEEAWVGLSGGFGEFRLGRTDATGLQALDSTVGQSGNAFNSVSGSGELGNNHGNVIRYISPTVSGFQLDAGYRMSTNKTSATDDNQTGITAFLLSYKTGPLAVYAGVSKSEAAAPAGAGTELAYNAVGATYDAGVAKFGLLVAEADTSAVADDKSTKQTILSAVFPLANGISIHGGYMTAKAAADESKSDGFSLVAVKALSKRTSIYGGYTTVSNQAAANRSWSLTGGGAAIGAGQDPSAIAVGMVHSF